MTREEWLRLKPFWLAQQRKPPSNSIKAKRTERGLAKGVGLVCVKSHVKPQVGLERHFIKHAL